MSESDDLFTKMKTSFWRFYFKKKGKEKPIVKSSQGLLRVHKSVIFFPTDTSESSHEHSSNQNTSISKADRSERKEQENVLPNEAVPSVDVNMPWSKTNLMQLPSY